MSQVNPLEVIYCKNCRFFKSKKVDDYSTVYSCSKGNSVEVDKPELRCNKLCYKKKTFNKYTQKKSTKNKK